jgi:Family of unknown function (DUF6504)
MRGIGGEPVEVWMRHDRPARFVWRDRIYTVLLVVDHRQAPDAMPDWCDAPGHAEVVGLADDAAVGRECWLVEATAERTIPPARYELCHDLDADRWSLSRS